MASKARFVNLDAMIPRADFALEVNESPSYENIQVFSVRDLASDGFIRPILRKPDFQRETNHWSPEQVASFLECFVNGDLIPSVIVWRSPSHLFVIDGGHRLSAIEAWLEDDYGDGPLSLKFFGDSISNEQKKAAKKARTLIADKIGSWQHFSSNLKNESLGEVERRRLNTAVSRAVHVQWVQGNAEKAEASFFKINTQGTPLDDIEYTLLSNRKKPIAIAARAIIRAGMGHKYWARFPAEVNAEIEEFSRKIHHTLFEPQIDTPIKTLDLPLGGSTGVRTALQVLVDLLLEANRNQNGEPKKLSDQADDTDGFTTKAILLNTLKLASRITGNDRGSLGLHPAIYFYGPTGKHQVSLFLGTAALIARKLVNNDKAFFEKFTSVRERLETILIENKELVATMLQKTRSNNRVKTYSYLLDDIIRDLYDDQSCVISDAQLVSYAKLSGKVFVGDTVDMGGDFSEDTKSAVFIRTALKSASQCPECRGYMDMAKSASYDHVLEKSKGGSGAEDNCQIMHPYCNQSVKNKKILT